MKLYEFRESIRILAVIALAGVLGAGCDSGPADGTTTAPGQLVTVRFPRLSHTQWENTVQDLFRESAPPELATSFDADPPLGRFDTNAARLKMTSGLWQDYQRAAEIMAERITGDTGALARIVPADLPDDPSARARAFIERFGTRAFRRPLAQDQVDRYLALFDQGAGLYDGLDAFTAGVRITIQAMLQSPHFLYRGELSSDADGQTIELSGYEVASRLSYAFWNTMPDDELFAAAAGGSLDTAEGVRIQALRMLDAPRTRTSFANFHQQLFALYEYADLDKSPDAFPGWRRELGQMMQTEAELFLDSVVFERDGTIGDLLTSPHTFVNDELAALYGLVG